MRKVLVLLLGVLVLVSACAAPTPAGAPAPTAEPTTAPPPAAQGKMRVSLSESLGIDDIPYLMALDQLREQGYEIETQAFARFDLGLTAIDEGSLDIVSSSLQPAWTAIAKDVPMRTIVARLRNADLVAAKQDIKTCSDLDGKNVGLSSATTLNAVLLKTYVANICPGTEYTVVAIPSSSNRFAALASGAIDATNLRLEDMLQLEQSGPGQFHSLVSFGDEFPELQAFAFHVHQDFAAQHPEAVRDFVREFLLASRQIQDKQVLRAKLDQYLTLDSKVRDRAANDYVDHKLWDMNGGLTADNIKSTLDFFITAEAVPNNLTPEMVADLSFLNQVLDKIGKE